VKVTFFFWWKWFIRNELQVARKTFRLTSFPQTGLGVANMPVEGMGG
jgi:uncharacterized membrane protein